MIQCFYKLYSLKPCYKIMAVIPCATQCMLVACLFHFLKFYTGVQLLSNALLQVHGQVIQLYMYIYPLLFRFLSHIDHYRALGIFPCTAQYVLTSYLFHLQWGVCVNCVRSPVGKRSVTPMRGECVCTHLSVCWYATAVTFKLSSFVTEKAQLPKPHPAGSV